MQTNDQASAESQVFKTMHSGEKKDYHQTFVNKSSKCAVQVPRVVCMMTMGQPKVVKRPLRTEWCYQPEAGDFHRDHKEVEPRASSDKI